MRYQCSACSSTATTKWYQFPTIYRWTWLFGWECPQTKQHR